MGKHNAEHILSIPGTVKQDTKLYRENVQKFIESKAEPASFAPYRVPMGVYEQRKNGMYMVRIRLGAGKINASQLLRVAGLGKVYGTGALHVTSRQDLQFHHVEIAQTVDVIESLAEVGLSTRGGGGNTLRNVTACPSAGVSKTDVFDVSPYSIAVAEYLMQFRDSYSLPRKYKIGFSGCGEDCSFASVTDLGFFAKIKDEQKGFSVYAAGGLGKSAAIGIKIEEFVLTCDIFKISLAIKRVFEKYGDRENRGRARLRYVLKRLREEGFVKVYKEELGRIENDGLPGEVPEVILTEQVQGDAGLDFVNSVSESTIRDNLIEENLQGFMTVRLNLVNGDIPADDLEKVANFADRYAKGSIRTTQLQDLLITRVAIENLNEAELLFDSLSIDVRVNNVKKILACSGAKICRLGICNSQGLAKAVAQKLALDNVDSLDTVVRISGCPNSCAQHQIAKLGLQGRAKKVEGKLMPFYNLYWDGKAMEGNARFGELVATVPAKRVPDMLAEILMLSTNRIDEVKAVAEKYELAEGDTVPLDYYCDYGFDEPFSLAGVKQGECSAGCKLKKKN